MSSRADRYLLTAYRSAARLPVCRALAVQAFRRHANAQRAAPGSARPDLLLDASPAASRLADLLRKGFSTGLRLTSSCVSAVLAELSQSTLVEDGSGRRIPHDQAVRETGSAALRWMNPHQTSPLLRALALEPRLLDVAERYLGCPPILHSSQIWLLHPPTADAASSAEYGWHYDIDDFRFLKVFFYLSDTAATRGQHMLVSGSHRDLRPHRLLHRRLADGDVRQRYDEADIRRMDGGPGDGFFEDTWLYHRATPPSSTRIMLQVEYCATGVLKRIEQRL